MEGAGERGNGEEMAGERWRPEPRAAPRRLANRTRSPACRTSLTTCGRRGPTSHTVADRGAKGVPSSRPPPPAPESRPRRVVQMSPSCRPRPTGRFPHVPQTHAANRGPALGRPPAAHPTAVIGCAGTHVAEGAAVSRAATNGYGRHARGRVGAAAGRPAWHGGRSGAAVSAGPR